MKTSKNINLPEKTLDQLLDDFISEHYSDLVIDDQTRNTLNDSFHFAGYVAQYHQQRFSDSLNELGKAGHKAGLAFSKFCKRLAKIK